MLNDPADPAAIAWAIDRIITNPPLAAQMRATSRRYAEERFSYDFLAARLRHALDGLEALDTGPG